MNMKNCGHRNIRKHRDIKGNNKYLILYISLEFDSLEKIKIIYSESKDNMGLSEKGVDYLSRSQGQSETKEIQKGKVCHQKCHKEGHFKYY